jgi:hypothetical protein
MKLRRVWLRSSPRVSSRLIFSSSYDNSPGEGQTQTVAGFCKKLAARIETSLLGDRAALQGAITVALHAARLELLSQSAGVSRPRKNAAAVRREIR